MGELYLFYGQEKLLIREAIEKIKSKYVPEAYEVVDFQALDGEDVTYDEIVNVCRVMPMLAEKRVVVIYNAVFLEEGKKKAEKSGSGEARFIEFLENIPPYLCLIFSAEKVDKRKKIYKAIQQKGAAKEFSPLSFKDKVRWIQARSAKYGKPMDQSAAVYMAQFTADLYHADGEIKKAVAYVTDKDEIEKRDLDAIMSKSTEANIFELIDYLAEGKVPAAVKILNELIYSGEKVLVILFMVSRHFMNLLAVKANEGLAFQELRNALNMHPFALKKMVLQAKNFTTEQIINILALCQQLDIDLKKGRIEEKKGLEMLLTKIGEMRKGHPRNGRVEGDL
ncbi:DNA polymerase III subunit delta [Thermosediminibacter oceani]|uniref:DNA polymerase III subunit delta n=1 Tax=Thermosediminibacter oceani (strain ATCC BAA-1034 / DSM 16646 / JW/IW-1228P) TaxID=555079 RepID=D9S2N1_THEOJ|nr:DNA polymerase III subunit delta [Thermosediminibacter oceani]ADL07658.1 DNA polymerase III, delta subunit [Thermosediminibacter oceani DSM 16646]